MPKYKNKAINVAMLPNKACTGRWGFCRIFKHFSGFAFFLLQAESTPAHTQVTQTVRLFLLDGKQKVKLKSLLGVMSNRI